MQKLSLLIYRFSKGFLATLVGLMVVVTLLEVTARNIFNHSFAWSEEFSRFLLVWITFIGASVVYKKGELVALDVLEKLSEKTRKIVFVIIQIVVIAFIAVLTYLGFNTTFSATIMNQTATGVGISMMYVYISVPLGMLFMLVHAIAFIFSPKNDHKEVIS